MTLVIFIFWRALAIARELDAGGRFSSSLSLSSSSDESCTALPRRPAGLLLPGFLEVLFPRPATDGLVPRSTIFARPLLAAALDVLSEVDAISLFASSEEPPAALLLPAASLVSSRTSRHSFSRVSNSPTAFCNGYMNKREVVKT